MKTIKILIFYRVTYGFTIYLTDYGIFDGTRIRQKDIAWFKARCLKSQWTEAFLAQTEPEFKFIALWRRDAKTPFEIFDGGLRRKSSNRGAKSLNRSVGFP